MTLACRLRSCFPAIPASPRSTGNAVTGRSRTSDLDPEADALPRRALAADFEGEAIVETYALRYRDGKPSLASVGCLPDDGRRTWAKSAARDLLGEMASRELCGRRARLKARELLAL